MNSDQHHDLETVAFQGLAGLHAQLDAWRQLAAAARADALFNGPDWVLAHARAFTPENDLFGWTARLAGKPVALFAMRMEPSRGRFALKRALSAADGTFDSDYCEPLVLPGYEAACAKLLLDRLAHERRIEAVVLSGVPHDSPFLAALRSELTRRGQPSRERESPRLALELPTSFEDYLGRLKPRMRTKVRSALRQAGESGARMTTCMRPDELDTYLEELFDLHGRRWRAAGQAGSFEDARRRTFYRDMAGQFLEKGQLRLTRLLQGKRALAAQLGVVLDGTYYQLQEGYDPECASQRVGLALRGLVTEALIGEGGRRYDFLAGDSSHKRDWGGMPEACTTLAFALPRWRARWSYRLRAWVDRVRTH